jgi:hypothetical protein
MFATLAPGTTHRIMTTQDLNIPDPPDGADPLTAIGFPKAGLPAAPLAIPMPVPAPVASALPAVIVLVPAASVAPPSLATSPPSGSPGVSLGVHSPGTLLVGAWPVQREVGTTDAGVRASWIDRIIEEDRAPGRDRFPDPDGLSRDDGPALVPAAPIASRSILQAWDVAIDACVAEGGGSARSSNAVAPSPPAIATDPALSPLEATLLGGAVVVLWGAWEVRSRKDDRHRSSLRHIGLWRPSSGTSSAPCSSSST